MEKQIHIIGGGIAGLSCAVKTLQLNPNATIHIYEKSNSLGGQLKNPFHHMWLVSSTSTSYNELCKIIIMKQQPVLTTYKFPKLDIHGMFDLAKFAICPDTTTKITDGKLSSNFKSFIDELSGFILLQHANLPVYTCGLHKPSSYISTNLYVQKSKLVGHIKKYLKRYKNCHIHLGAEIKFSNNQYFHDNKVLKGKIVIAVDPYNANRYFGIKTPIVAPIQETQFRFVFSIHSKDTLINKMADFNSLNKGYTSIIFSSQAYWNVIAVINKSDNGYKYEILLNSFNAVGMNGKYVYECSEDEFKLEVMNEIGLNDPNAKFTFPDYITFKNNKIHLKDESQMMFVPTVGTYETLTDMRTDDKDVYVCGVYVKNSDLLFTVDASIETGFRVAETIQGNF